MINPLHVQGCDLIARLYAAGDGPLDFSDLGFAIEDEIVATDANSVLTRYGVCLKPAATEGTVLVVIRGTRTLIEWMSDAEAVLVDCPFAAGTKVHRGFAAIYATFALKSAFPLLAYLETHPCVVVMGHSLGGPLATYLAAQVRANELVCYASPKPGDPAFGAWVKAQVAERTLYANPKDIVPHLALTITNLLAPFVNEDFEHIDFLTPLDPASVTPPVSTDWVDAHNILNYRRLIAAHSP